MTKKYRTVLYKQPVNILNTASRKDERPLVYEYFGVNAFGNEAWLLSRTVPLGCPTCEIEEVPEEPIGVGYSWTKAGRLYKVVYRLGGTGEYYVVVQAPKDTGAELVAAAPDGHTFWCTDEIRQESAK